MKNLSILKQFLAIGALLFMVTSCQKKEAEIDTADLQDEIPEHLLGEPVPSIEVAKIQKDGHEYLFEAIGEEGEIIIIEKLYGAAEENLEDSGVDIDATPYEAFISLTDDNVKIPALIAATVDESVIEASNREINEASTMLEILDPTYDELEDRACPDYSWSEFSNTFCAATPVNPEERFCNPSWRYTTSATNSSGSFRKTKSWTLVCGRVRIMATQVTYDSYGFYVKHWEKEFTDGIYYVNVSSSNYRKRGIFRQPQNGGRYRAYTKFHN